MATYAYDYRGLRISKTTSAGTTTYLWRPDGLLYRESGPWGYAVYYWAGEGQLVQMDWCYNETTKRLVAHTNARGDVVSLTDRAGGYPIVATYRYGPWGELLSAEGTCAGQPIRYAGYYHDAETGLYYLKGRYYSPALGRFLTRDGVSRAPSYAYAANDPLCFTDPTGQFAVIATFGSSLSLFGGKMATLTVAWIPGKGVRSFGSDATIGALSFGWSVNIDVGLAFSVDDFSDLVGRFNGFNATVLGVNGGMEVLGLDEEGRMLVIVYGGINGPPTEVTIAGYHGYTFMLDAGERPPAQSTTPVISP